MSIASHQRRQFKRPRQKAPSTLANHNVSWFSGFQGAGMSTDTGTGARGLSIARAFSKPDIHPYDEVAWERRDVEQTNWKTGETIFQQKGVEFPPERSANAGAIVTTKYFRGAVGSENRESSLRQLIDRVVSRYVAAGIDNGYFASADDGATFGDELTWLLLHQMFSFNSPVWFNVGTDSPQQVSACFILAVDDTLGSILNWYREEGLIFKGGSGSGVNLSNIRSSAEPLASGGIASGPVSFMRAVEQDGSFDLTARSDGHTVETVRAKELFREIAAAAWSCGDPGIQYDDTTNAWHTNPESGRINASNPCSEYMSLDNSSCNLASLNLLAFLRGDDTFDAEAFTKAVELVITAMDISICFADFPTEPIAKTTRDYRQLGIGYANLGALLMATGHGYDSEGGRSLAAAITSLMTAVAYRRSAELAGVVGQYAGNARNAEAHTRVMRKHAAANDTLRTSAEMDGAIHARAGQEWSRALELGSVNGWRNAQASVLAPTGTIGFMMDCDTTGIEPDFSLAVSYT